MFEKKNAKDLSNTELKLYLKTLEDSFEAKKIELRAICEEMDAIEKEYLGAKHQLEIRRSIFN